MGLEPTIFRVTGGRVDHYTTGPVKGLEWIWLGFFRLGTHEEDLVSFVSHLSSELTG
jgi:hypothetical protein